MEHFAAEANDGPILPTDTFTRLRQDLLIDLARRHHILAMNQLPLCYDYSVEDIDNGDRSGMIRRHT